ncbi:MAG: ATP-binding protein [Myxococcota bacterium]
MLEALEFRGVGPASSLSVKFRKRLNFLAGDNGLGKTFLLDAAWWALTRTWARQMLRPHRPPAKATIEYRYKTKTSRGHRHKSEFDRANEQWPLKRGRPPIPGLVLYAQVDGGFSVWDPARNYWKGEQADRQSAYLFSPQEVWHGLPLDEPVKFCNGLVADWASWKLEAGESFEQLCRVLRSLSPSTGEQLEPGELMKISLADARRHPTIRMSYGHDVPLVHASAGIRRIVALAYLLVWSWREHIDAAALRGDEPAQRIIFLIDEVEAHLHPQWQRRIVPALLDVMEALTGQHDVPVQLITATHSPLVLASAETRFDIEADAIWELDLVDGQVQLGEYPWSRRGDANAWLTSSVFDLREPRSLEAEEAITAALALLRKPKATPAEVKRVDQLLREALSDVDRFWVRWTQYRHDLKARRGRAR